ncbi:MAG: hypothetical protein ACI8P3_002462 [Saprospiraceae bacterium]
MSESLIIMNKPLRIEGYIEKFLKPETVLEKALLDSSEFQEGLLWGKPRYGHPEGEVLFHIKEVLDNIEKLPVDKPTRSKLRLIAFVHDIFKYAEDKGGSDRDWSRHHSVLARQFMENHISDQIILDVIELHDEVYYCWRLKMLYNKVEEGNARLKAFKARIGDNIQLYYLFFKCDTLTGDKTQSPLYWFEVNTTGIEIVNF